MIMNIVRCLKRRDWLGLGLLVYDAWYTNVHQKLCLTPPEIMKCQPLQCHLSKCRWLNASRNKKKANIIGILGTKEIRRKPSSSEYIKIMPSERKMKDTCFSMYN